MFNCIAATIVFILTLASLLTSCGKGLDNDKDPLRRRFLLYSYEVNGASTRTGVWEANRDTGAITRIGAFQIGDTSPNNVVTGIWNENHYHDSMIIRAADGADLGFMWLDSLSGFPRSSGNFYNFPQAPLIPSNMKFVVDPLSGLLYYGYYGMDTRSYMGVVDVKYGLSHLSQVKIKDTAADTFQALALHPSSQKVYVSTAIGKISAVSVQSGATAVLENDKGMAAPSWMQFSPRGDRLFVKHFDGVWKIVSYTNFNSSTGDADPAWPMQYESAILNSASDSVETLDPAGAMFYRGYLGSSYTFEIFDTPANLPIAGPKYSITVGHADALFAETSGSLVFLSDCEQPGVTARIHVFKIDRSIPNAVGFHDSISIPDGYCPMSLTGGEFVTLPTK